MASQAPGLLIRATRERLAERTTSKRYKQTYSFSDETGLLFELDVVGDVMSHLIDARGPDGTPAWSTKRNRTILPTLWRLKDAGGREVGALRQRLFRRGIWRAESPDGAEIFTLRDPRKGFTYIFDLPGAPDRPDFAVMRGDDETGALTRVASEQAPRGRGPLKALARLLHARDWVMAVPDARRAPDTRLAALAILLAQEITIRLRGMD